jgi:ATP-dependent DNA helicase HFM1/MER3
MWFVLLCSSRKGTIDAASTIVKEAEAHAQVAAYSGPAARSTGSSFVRDMQQLQRLRAAAANTQAKALASVLVAGVGFHNAAMEPSDRTIVEELFKANDLAVSGCVKRGMWASVTAPGHARSPCELKPNKPQSLVSSGCCSV